MALEVGSLPALRATDLRNFSGTGKILRKSARGAGYPERCGGGPGSSSGWSNYPGGFLAPGSGTARCMREERASVGTEHVHVRAASLLSGSLAPLQLGRPVIRLSRARVSLPPSRERSSFPSSAKVLRGGWMRRARGVARCISAMTATN